MEILVGLAVTAATAVYMVAFGRYGKATTNRVGERRGRELLAEVVERHGGDLDADGWRGRVQFGDIDISVEIQVDSDERWSHCQTVVAARFERGSGPSFYLQPRLDFRVTEPFGELPELSERCVVAADDRVAAARIWSPRAQEIAAELFRPRADDAFTGKTPGSVASDGHVVAVQRRGPFRRAETYERAFELAAELARARPR